MQQVGKTTTQLVPILNQSSQKRVKTFLEAWKPYFSSLIATSEDGGKSGFSVLVDEEDFPHLLYNCAALYQIEDDGVSIYRPGNHPSEQIPDPDPDIKIGLPEGDKEAYVWYGERPYNGTEMYLMVFLCGFAATVISLIQQDGGWEKFKASPYQYVKMLEASLPDAYMLIRVGGDSHDSN